MPARQLGPGCYRIASGVRIVTQETRTFAITAYPLRVLPLQATTTHLLALCDTEHTCEQLARELRMPIKRVEALCDQLRWKNLLEVGSILPPRVWPQVSVVIPSYNRAKQLERCLRSLFCLDYPSSNLEIIVVDDASTDETGSMLQHYMLEHRNLHVITHKQRLGVGNSRNTGSEVAQYELIAYIDSDCVATTDWLTQLVPAFQGRRVTAVGGMIRAYECQSMLGRYEDVRSSLFTGERAQQLRLEGPLTYLPTANLIVRRCMWLQLGGFAPLSYGEDVDFCHRLLQTGALMYYLPQGIVYHDYRTRLRTFLTIRAAYASSEAALLQRRAIERRTLLLPPEQATFAVLIIGALWCIIKMILSSVGAQFIAPWCLLTPSYWARRGKQTPGRNELRPYRWVCITSIFAACVLTLLGARSRLRKVREQHLPVETSVVLQATARGHLSYTYHLCRHITRYYTLPLLITGVLFPPLLLLLLILCAIVILVDYVRLKPHMNIAQYAFCSMLDDCAYEVGVVQGCIKHKTWKPLVPTVKKRAG